MFKVASIATITTKIFEIQISIVLNLVNETYLAISLLCDSTFLTQIVIISFFVGLFSI